MSFQSQTLFRKVLLGASLSLVIQPLSATPRQINQLGMDLPLPKLTTNIDHHLSSSDQTNNLDTEPLSNYGNPCFYSVNGKRYQVLTSSAHYDQVGIASWYGKDFHGKLTANREIFDMYQISAASKTLPLPCYVQVTNLNNGKSLVVRVNDRGPYIDGRLIDLSYAAAKALGFDKQGITKVRVTTLNSTHAQQADHYLQIGSFSVLSNAEHFKSKLEATFNESVRIQQTNNPALGTFYRVEVGPFNDINELTDAQREFKAKGYHHTIAILG